MLKITIEIGCGNGYLPNEIEEYYASNFVEAREIVLDVYNQYSSFDDDDGYTDIILSSEDIKQLQGNYLFTPYEGMCVKIEEINFDTSRIFEGLCQFLLFVYKQIAERDTIYEWVNMPTLLLPYQITVMFGCMVHHEHVIIAHENRSVLVWRIPNTTDIYSVDEIGEDFRQHYIERRVMKIINALLEG